MKKATDVVGGKVFPFILLFLSVGWLSCGKDDDSSSPPTNITYSGSFVKSKDNVVTTATGTTTAVFNPVTRELSYELSWTGLSSNAVGMHFHDAGPIIIDIKEHSNGMSGTASGKAILTVEQVNDLNAGKIYSQIHSQNYPGGEVIATMMKSGTAPSMSGAGSGY